MIPDGYLVVRMAANPDDDMHPAELKIPFSEIRGHKPEAYGFRIEFPDKRVIIPWSNIHFNSEEYQSEQV
jgi:hypothetical protein